MKFIICFVGANTRKYPKIRGTPHNLFFIDHKHPEDAAGSNQFALQSHSNEFEVAFVVELIRYFVRNVRLEISSIFCNIDNFKYYI